MRKKMLVLIMGLVFSLVILPCVFGQIYLIPKNAIDETGSDVLGEVNVSDNDLTSLKGDGDYINITQWTNYTNLFAGKELRNLTLQIEVDFANKGGETSVRASYDGIIDTEPTICLSGADATGIFLCDLYSLADVNTTERLENLTIQVYIEDNVSPPSNGNVQIDFIGIESDFQGVDLLLDLTPGSATLNLTEEEYFVCSLTNSEPYNLTNITLDMTYYDNGIWNTIPTSVGSPLQSDVSSTAFCSEVLINEICALNISILAREVGEYPISCGVSNNYAFFQNSTNGTITIDSDPEFLQAYYLMLIAETLADLNISVQAGDTINYSIYWEQLINATNNLADALNISINASVYVNATVDFNNTINLNLTINNTNNIDLNNTIYVNNTNDIDINNTVYVNNTNDINVEVNNTNEINLTFNPNIIVNNTQEVNVSVDNFVDINTSFEANITNEINNTNIVDINNTVIFNATTINYTDILGDVVNALENNNPINYTALIQELVDAVQQERTYMGNLSREMSDLVDLFEDKQGTMDIKMTIPDTWIANESYVIIGAVEDYKGNSIEPTYIVFKIIDGQGRVLFDDDTPTLLGLGLYSISYDVPSNVKAGTYTAYISVRDGSNIQSSEAEFFQILKERPKDVGSGIVELNDILGNIWNSVITFLFGTGDAIVDARGNATIATIVEIPTEG